MSRRELLRLGLGATIALPLALASRRCDLMHIPRGPAAPTPVLPVVEHAPRRPPVLPFDPDEVPLDEAAFPLGVQVGAVRDRSALAWTFAADDAGKRLRVWQEGGEPGTVLLDHDGIAEARDGYIKVTVSGLEPGARYRYAFFDERGGALRARSAIGTFRTAFAPGAVAPMTIGATACTRFEYMPYRTLEALATHDLDAFCQLGDMSYNDGAATREEFRALWRRTLQDPGYRAVLSRTSLYATWDDHEIRNDWRRDSLPPGVWEAGREAFLETLPIPRIATPSGDRFWDSYRWGSSVELFVLDCRGERRPPPRGLPFASTLARFVPGIPEPLSVSDEQLRWLMDGLSASPCHFKVVLTSVPIVDLPAFWPGQGDRWQGTPRQRDELLDHITENRLQNVWFLTADLHFPAVARVERSGPRRRLREILVGPGGNHEPRLLAAQEKTPNLLSAALPKSQFDFYGTTPVGTLLTFDPAADTVRVRFLDGATGEPIYDRILREETLG